MAEQLENLTDQGIIEIFTDSQKITNLQNLFELFYDPESALVYNRFFDRVLAIKNNISNWAHHPNRVCFWTIDIKNWTSYFKLLALVYPPSQIEYHSRYIINVFDLNQLVDIYHFYYRAKIFSKSLCQIYRIRMAMELQNERIDYHPLTDNILTSVIQIVNNNTELIFDFCERQAIQVVNQLSGMEGK